MATNAQERGNKTEVFKLRVSTKELERWREVADHVGLSLSAWVRQTIAVALLTVPLEEPLPTKELPPLPPPKPYSPPPASITSGPKVFSPDFKQIEKQIKNADRQQRRSGRCDHRVPVGAFCKACAEDLAVNG